MEKRLAQNGMTKQTSRRTPCGLSGVGYDALYGRAGRTFPMQNNSYQFLACEMATL